MTDESSKELVPYKPGNVDENGDFKVGKGRPPEHGKFRKGDGRKRGRRARGTKNIATDFNEELGSKITLKVDGKPRRMTKQRAIMMRLMDNASRGQNAAINTILAYAERFGIEVQLESDQQKEENSEYLHMKDLTKYEMELLGLLLDKATGQSMPKMDDGKLYEPDHPLAYLEDPNDSRNFYLDQTVEGVVWKRFQGSRFPDFIYEIPNKAYHSAALPRVKLTNQNEEEIGDEN